MAATTHAAHQPATWDLHACLGVDASSAASRELPRAAEPARLPRAGCNGRRTCRTAPAASGIWRQQERRDSAGGAVRWGRAGEDRGEQGTSASRRWVIGSARKKTEVQGALFCRERRPKRRLRPEAAWKTEFYGRSAQHRPIRFPPTRCAACHGLTCHTHVTQSESRWNRLG